MARKALTPDDLHMLHEAGREGLFSETFRGKKVVLTGTMSMTRKDITAVIKAAGGTVVDKAVHGVDYLVVGDTGAHGMTVKINAATALGVEVLEEHEFAALLTVVTLS